VEVVVSFFERLFYFQIRQGEHDSIGCSPSKRSKFKVKSFYQELTSHNGSIATGGVLCVDNSIRKNIDD
jgi:hypothetical protein